MLLKYPAMFIRWDKKMGNPRSRGIGPMPRRIYDAVVSVPRSGRFD